jgi:hypothetical protein
MTRHRRPSQGRNPLSHRASEAGSAYLVAILALVVLTIVGLALALITQTEMQIGSNERSVERAFYAADSGIALATAKTLVTRRPAWAELYKLQEPTGTGVPLEHLVEVSPFHPINYGFSNLTSINGEAETGSKVFYRVVHAVTSTAVRRFPGSEVPLAERQVTAMISFDPWEESVSAFEAIENEAQLATIKF